MNAGMKRGIGIVLGLVVMVFAARHFLYSYRDGNPKWFMMVMVCGMLLILYYTMVGSKRNDDDEED